MLDISDTMNEINQQYNAVFPSFLNNDLRSQTTVSQLKSWPNSRAVLKRKQIKHIFHLFYTLNNDKIRNLVIYTLSIQHMSAAGASSRSHKTSLALSVLILYLYLIFLVNFDMWFIFLSWTDHSSQT